MRSKRTPRFNDLFRALPADIRKQAYAAYRLFQRNPYHPSLHFKKVNPTVYSARVGISYRVLGRREEDDLIVWFWIGTHAEYDRLLARW
jgi:hypothetical protein